MGDGDHPSGPWPRYNERDREHQEEHGWIARELRGICGKIKDMEARLIVIEKTHERDAVFKAWFGKALNGLWFIIGLAAARGVEWFFSHRPIVVSIAASAAMLAAASVSQG